MGTMLIGAFGVLHYPVQTVTFFYLELIVVALYLSLVLRCPRPEYNQILPSASLRLTVFFELVWSRCSTWLALVGLKQWTKSGSPCKGLLECSHCSCSQTLRWLMKPTHYDDAREFCFGLVGAIALVLVVTSLSSTQVGLTMLPQMQPTPGYLSDHYQLWS